MKLKNIRVEEVSMVDKAANKKRYALLKRFSAEDADISQEDREALASIRENLRAFDQVMAALGDAPSGGSSKEDEDVARCEALLNLVEKEIRRDRANAYAVAQHDAAVRLGETMNPAAASAKATAAARAKEQADDWADTVRLQEARDAARDGR